MIHETAIIDKGARIGEDVHIGPYTIIKDKVVIGSGSRISSHVVIESFTTIGENNTIAQFASIGGMPQDLKFKGEDSELVIGDNNSIREFVTINRGTAHGGGITRIGNDNLLMAYIHIAHDCQVANNVVMANCATLGGHVKIGSNVNLGGAAGIHQFVSVGDYAFIGGMSMTTFDIPPYVLANGNRIKLFGLNVIGLQRHNFEPETLQILKRVYRIIMKKDLSIKEAIKIAEQTAGECKEALAFVSFVKESKRGIPR